MTCLMMSLSGRGNGITGQFPAAPFLSWALFLCVGTQPIESAQVLRHLSA